jgi:hypothetical protein
LLGARATGCQIAGAAVIEARMTVNHARLLALLAAIVAAAAMRLLPHPPNFTPIGAMALFSGAYLGRRGLAFVAPVAALLLSDAILGFYPELLFVYLSVAATVLIGWALQKHKTVLRIGLAAVAGSVLFYLVTNFGVWLVMDYYPKTAAGLMASYVAAIPFFQNSAIGDLFFAGVLFGGFALLERAVPKLRQEALPQPA